MTLNANKEKIEEIIKKISLIEVDYSGPIKKCLNDVEKLIDLKTELNIIKSNSRFLNNPSLSWLHKEKKKLLVRKDFSDRKWIDPQKILMAITPGFFLICLAAPPVVLGILTFLYLI
tara:strand:+ start:386 stop:736 length:351 start_codon:yes stop_codon:yes gene_type:complete